MRTQPISHIYLDPERFPVPPWNLPRNGAGILPSINIPSEVKRKGIQMKKPFLLVIGAVILAIGAFISWRSLDRMGWVLHRQLTHVWVPVEQAWGVGEYLNCTAQPRTPLITPPGSPGIENLGCVRGSERERNNGHLRAEDMEISYWGRIAIPYPESAELYRRIMATSDSAPHKEWPFQWRCRRNEASVTCWAVN